MTGDPIRDLVPPRRVGRPAPPGGLDRALTTAAGRRRRRLVEVVGGSAMVIALVLVAGARRPETTADRIGVTGGGADRRTTASAQPGRARPSLPVAAVAASSPPSAPALGADRLPRPVPQGAATVPPGSHVVPPPTPGPDPSPSEEAMPEHEYVYLSHEDQDVQSPCESSKPEVSWCLSAAVRAGSSSGVRTLVLRACRPAGNVAGSLSFSQEMEADFAVRQGGTVLWRWSDGVDNPSDSHSVAVERWQCAVWTTDWSGPLPAGDYALDATSSSYTLADDQRKATTTFHVS